MITRQTVAAVLTTTAIAFSICSPARAASLAATVVESGAPRADSGNNKPHELPAGESESRARECK